MQKIEPEVEVVVDLQLSDLLRANLWSNYSKRSTQLGLAGTVVLTLIFALFISTNLLTPVYALIPLGIIFLDILIPLAIIFETKRNYSAVKDFQKQIHYRLSRDGYTATDGQSSSHVSWASVLKVVESSQSLNLYLGRTYFALLPRKFFKTAADYEMTKEILKTALGDKAHLR